MKPPRRARVALALRRAAPDNGCCRKRETTMKAAVIVAAIAVALATSGPVRAAEIGKAGKVVKVVKVASVGLFEAAERGDPRAQTKVGFMYETGRGLPQDYMLAVAWYRRAAEQGYPPAQHLLGMMYNKGQGVAENYVVAHKWLNLAAAGARAREREYFLRIRDAVGFKMTVAQITEAQWRARHWYPVPEH
jgi:TPR repeat protein